MGFSLSWLAIRGKSRDTIHRELKITPTGIYSEFPEMRCMGAQLGDWYLVIKDHEIFDDLAQIAQLSQGCEVVSCSLVEGANASESSGWWCNGKKVWSIRHIAQQESKLFEVKGELPPEFASIRERLEAKQKSNDDVDYIFDVPIETARSVTGYRHDIQIDLGPKGYEQLNVVERLTVSRGFTGLMRKFMGFLGKR